MQTFIREWSWAIAVPVITMGYVMIIETFF